jgi:hypothetical protein
MPDLDDTAAGARDSRGSSDVPSRRAVLRVAAGAGAAGLGAAVLARVATSAEAAAVTRRAGRAGRADRAAVTSAGTTSRAAERAEADSATIAEPIVVHVRDARTGEIDVFRGTSQIRLNDKDLAARLVRASQ